MEFTKPKLMQSDCLQTTKFLCSSIYKTKIGKLILLMFLAIHGSFTIGYIYFSLNVEKDFKIFVSQAPLTFTWLWGLLEATIILIKSDLIENLPQELRLWSTDSAGEEIDKKIKKEAKFVKLFSIAIHSAGIFTSILFIKPSPNDSKFFFALYFFDKYFPEQSNLFGFLYRSTFPLLGYIVFTHALQYIYYIQHVKYQVTMFHKHVEDLVKCDGIDGTSEINNLKMYYDKEFQKEISRRLNFLIKRHNEIKDVLQMNKDEKQYLIGIFSLAGGLLGIGFAMWLIMFYEVIFHDCLMVVRTVLQCGYALIMFCAVILCGQILEDVSLEIRTLTFEWYLFDNFNKKKLLIFMINADRPIKMQFLNNSVNFELGLKIVKAIYAVASVLFKMKIHH